VGLGFWKAVWLLVVASLFVAVVQAPAATDNGHPTCAVAAGCSPASPTSCTGPACSNQVTVNDPALMQNDGHSHEPWWLWTTWILLAGAFVAWGFRKPIRRILEQSADRTEEPPPESKAAGRVRLRLIKSPEGKGSSAKRQD